MQPTIFLNGSFLTMDPARSQVEAMLVQGGRIAAVGSRQEVEALASGSRSVDLGGGTVVPGFNDCHCHILAFGLTLGRLDVSVEAVSSIADIQRRVAERALQAAPGEWVVGNGYNQNVLAERRHPTRHDLDAVSHGRPVLLFHTSGHGLTCNSRALEIAGVGADSATPPGGDIVRDASGAPTGVLMETPAMDLVAQHIPHPTLEEGADAAVAAMRAMASQGITSATDAATGEERTIETALAMYRGALASGHLAGRIGLMPQIRCVAPPDSREACPPSAFDVGNDPLRLRIAQTKIFSDGALTTRTAAVRDPYADSVTNRGILLWEPEVLVDMIQRAHKTGWQIATHAIGDQAIALVLDAYEHALRQHPRRDHRHRIEHCMLLDNALATRIAELGVVPALQPGFIARLGDAYVQALGPERAAHLNPMALFREHGIAPAFSSDRPVIPGAPLDGIRSAVARTTPEGEVLGPEHRISPEEAIHHYTLGSARAERMEADKGALRVNMLADFAVLSHSPLTREGLETTEVVMTVVGGEVVYERSASTS